MPQYHVWFSTKHRKRLLQGDVATLAEQAICEVAARDAIRLLECKAVVGFVEGDSGDAGVVERHFEAAKIACLHS